MLLVVVHTYQHRLQLWTETFPVIVPSVGNGDVIYSSEMSGLLIQTMGCFCLLITVP